MVAYEHIATVKGRGLFPIDMLRYDGCHPLGPEHAGRITASLMGDMVVGEIKVRKVNARTLGYSPDRWSSFGWIMTDVAPPRKID
jgi:hypothetical protein